MSTEVHPASVVSGRQFVMMVVIALHVFVIGALMTMKIDYHRYQPAPELQWPADIREQPRPQQPIETHIGAALQPVARIDPRAPSETIVVPVEDPVPVPQPPIAMTERGPVTPMPAVVPPTSLQYQAVRSADEYYPPQSLRLAEEGVAIVKVCVGADGLLQARPSVTASSGSRRLDAAAITWAREALRFTPATRNGVPVAACKDFRVNFTLR